MIKVATPDAAMTAALENMQGEFSRKRNDCWRAASRAFEALWGIDPMGPHTYATLSEAKALVREGGGPEAYCQRLADRSGLIACEPAPGVIGMVNTDRHELGWSGGLCIRPNVWAVKHGSDVTFLERHIRCWGVPDGY